MKKMHDPKNLPMMTAALGAVGFLLRWMLYTFCLDDKFLLPANHPLEIGLWGFSAAALALIIALVWKLDGSSRYEDNFAPSAAAAVGHILAAAGILLTALLNEPQMAGNLGMLWKVTGVLAGPCLMLAALSRVQGKKPFFLLHLIPCLFLVFHIINHYQVWSGNPQLTDYVFALFATMTLMFFAFYTAAFDVDAGKRRMHLGMGLAAVYLCMVNLPETEYLYLYAGGILWVLSDLCTLYPKPKPVEESEKENDPS